MILLSKSEGIGGVLKSEPEDFVVEEITQNGTVLELGKKYAKEELGFAEAASDAKFTLFVMQKRDWNTVQALKTIARRYRRGIKSIGFAGTKDRTSVSTQLCSIFGIKPDQIAAYHGKDISINGAWSSDKEVKLGELSGNRFTITIKECKKIENIDKINSELDGIFPNYFGEQRFGYRENNVQIGLEIIKGNFKEAAMKFLTDTTNEKNEDAVIARKKLIEEQDFKNAIEYFPKYLKYEKQLLEHLAYYPTDFAGAIRKLPRTISLMFVHSVESYIFNAEIERCINEGRISQGSGNIVGYDNEINDEEKKILDELGIAQEDFKVKSMPELNCKGGKRLLFAPYSDFSWAKTDSGSVKMRFALQAGSYATVLLEEFIKA